MMIVDHKSVRVNQFCVLVVVTALPILHARAGGVGRDRGNARALSGMTFSVIGEASSHGVAELSESVSLDQDDHSHSHDDFGEKSEIHLHHDAGNHSHESMDHLKLHLISNYSISIRQPTPYAGDSPRSFRHRLDRPPKALLIV